MKVLLMLLVLANLGFFAWQHWYLPDSSPAVAVRTGDPGKGLTLIGEEADSGTERLPSVTREESDLEVITVETTPAEAQAPESVCATLGPFDDQQAARGVRDRLVALGFTETGLRESGGQIRSGFWVYLPPYPSRDAAKQVEGDLRTLGVQDLFIVAGAEQQNAISLGLFSTPERADQRAAEIGRLGFSPRVAERFRDATVYWVDFRERSEAPLLPERVGLIPSSETLPEKHPISCDDIAVTTPEA